MKITLHTLAGVCRMEEVMTELGLIFITCRVKEGWMVIYG